MRALVVTSLFVAACGSDGKPTPPAATPKDSAPPAPAPEFSLAKARAGFRTTIDAGRNETPIPVPPAGVFETVTYQAPLGRNLSFVTPEKPGARRPAIVWIQGGF